MFASPWNLPEAELVARLNGRLGELAGSMEIAFTSARQSRLVATMPVAGARQPFGLLHGGASCVLAETMGSTAASLHRPDRLPVGVDINATHHRSARSGQITGVCVPLYQGGSTATYGIDIFDEDEQRVCTARLTCRLLVPPANSPLHPLENSK